MNKSHFFNVALVIPIFLYAVSYAGAGVQTWTLKDGSTVEAEFVVFSGTSVGLRMEDDGIVKVPFKHFSDESQRRLELEDPPDLTFSLKKDAYMKDFPFHVRSETQRPSEMRVHYGILIKAQTMRPYRHPLHLDLFIIGKERNGDRYIILDRQQRTFTFTKDNKSVYEFKSPREVALQNFIINSEARGEIYYGYLALVKDERGKVVGHEASHAWLFDNLERLQDRHLEHFMDETCARAYPTRPTPFPRP